MTAPLLSIHVDSILVPEYRQRTSDLDKGKIVELSDSFKRGKQLHPIILRRELVEGAERWVLVAGFRRLCTRRLVPDHTMRCGSLTLEAKHIAATDWGQLEEVERQEMEFEENVLREDLSIPEKAAALKKLNEVRQAAARSKGEIYTTAKLTDEARISPTKAATTDRINDTALLLNLADHLDDPQAASIKSMADARAFLKKKMSAERNADLRTKYEEVARTGTPNRLLLGSCYDPAIIKELPLGQFDIALFDPPYGIGADKFGEQGGASAANAGHSYADDEAVFSEVCNRVPHLLEAILKPEAHVYCFIADFPHFERLRLRMELSGFAVWPRPLVWAKGRGIAPVPNRGPRYTYELILFARRGNKPVEILANDVLNYPAVQTPRHGAEKPVALYQDLLARSVRPGNLVVDPFAGSGTIFPAANATSCIAWGIEREQAYYDLAVSRLMEKPGEPPAGKGEPAAFSLKEFVK